MTDAARQPASPVGERHRHPRPAAPSIPQALPLDLEELIEDPATRIVVCCGAGGVGKTTTSAALALAAAEAGRTVVVLTIDPARRLAQSLGLVELDNEPRRVDVPGAKGELHAMMLDMKRTFDDVVCAHATPERAEQILANPFYQALSSSFAGTQEYMAMEKLGQLRASEQWDLIVVDTPPSRSALDFLDAPNRMSRFLDGTMIRLLTAPARAGGRAGMRLVGAGFLVFSRIISKILGGQLLRDISAFVSALDTMFGGFRERATATYELLRRPGTWFVVVATPEPDALREASYFVDRLSAEQMPLAGLVLNRTHPPATTALTATRADGAAEEVLEADGEGAALAAGALRVHADRMSVAAREQRLADRFTSAHPQVAVRTVPAAAGDVHDLDGLRGMADALTGPNDDTPTGVPRTRVLPARRR
ncbi:ArsA family ATPase [Geodermatophilus sp. SYSU D00965]